MNIIHYIYINVICIICSKQGLSADLSADSEYLHSYRTVPELYHHDKLYFTSFTQDQHFRELTVVIKAFEKKFTLDLILNTGLLSGDYLEKQIHSAGESTRRPSHHDLVKSNCYYHGMVRGIVQSYAAISTCHGVRGMFNDGDMTYHIEPSTQPNAEHYVFRDADRKPHTSTCGVRESKPAAHNVTHMVKRSIRAPAASNYSTRYIELYLVADRRLYSRLGSDMVRVYQRCKDIVNVVGRLYKQLNIYVVLVGVEVWTSRDQITVTPEADNTMKHFLHYRSMRINPRHRNDNAQLLTGIQFNSGVVGKAVKGPICTYEYSGGVNMDNNVLVGQVATTVAHELGHNLGMHHDNDTCFCPDAKCIMAVTTGGAHPTKWSSCSVTSLNDAFEQGMDYCLRNLPNLVFQGPVCGNNLMEDGEECDCGLSDACDSKCCDAATCRLKPGAICATGACCDLDTCKVKVTGVKCKSVRGECDLPEFCDGHTEFCPEDVHKLDTTLCDSDTARCYNGACPSHDSQCRLLWGPTGHSSDQICYDQLNVQGSSHGNCGFTWTNKTYSKCDKRDVMCGMLHCIHLNEKLAFWKDMYAVSLPASFITTKESHAKNKKFVCRGAILNVVADMPDPGMVPDGAKCGHEQVCLSHRCRPMSILTDPSITNVNVSKACLAGCSGHGVCNSRGNCHCEAGWGPPTCASRGLGGSEDSNTANQPYSPDDTSRDQARLVGLLVFFLIILPLIALVVYCAIRHRVSITQWWHKKSSINYRFTALFKSSTPKHPQPSPVTIPTPSADNHTPVTRAHSLRFGRPPQISNPVLTSSTNRESKIYLGVAQDSGHARKSRPQKAPETLCVDYLPQKSAVYMNVPHKPPARPPPPRPRSTCEPQVDRNTATRSSSFRSPASQLCGEVTVHNNDLRSVQDYRDEVRATEPQKHDTPASQTPKPPVKSKPETHGDKHDYIDENNTNIKLALKPPRTKILNPPKDAGDSELSVKFKQRSSGDTANTHHKPGVAPEVIENGDVRGATDVGHNGSVAAAKKKLTEQLSKQLGSSTRPETNKSTGLNALAVRSKPAANVSGNGEVLTRPGPAKSAVHSAHSKPTASASYNAESSTANVKPPHLRTKNVARTNSTHKPQPLPKPVFKV